MNKPHKHAEIIKQWADGAEIESLSNHTESWLTVERPTFYEDEQYRVKPQPVECWVTCYIDTDKKERLGGHYTTEKLASEWVDEGGRIIHMREVTE
jgi:hypothetical protein